MSAEVSPTLDTCAEERIHIPGAIQPHGAALLLREETLEVLGGSENALHFLGLTETKLEGHHLDQWMDVTGLKTALAQSNDVIPAPVPLQVGDMVLDGVPFRTGGLLFLELERADKAFNAPAFYQQVQQALARAEAAKDLTSLYRECAETIAQLTGFDRVMVYRFDAEWNGSVVGESLQPGADSYMGHHFPASDIPPQARELYRKNRLRIIPTSTYQPARIFPALNPLDGQPYDLSKSVLRSVSPIHLEYLRNMGVQSSMSVSLLRRGQLWGLIACHHSKPRTLPYAVRAACELYGQVVSAHILFQEEQVRSEALLEVRRVQSEFFDHFSSESNFVDALVRYTPYLLKLVEATGAALCVGKRIILLGECPTEEQVRGLRAWLKTQPLDDTVATDHLAALYPKAASFDRIASGLLAFSISLAKTDLVLWFRPEFVTSITWAGDPNKAMEQQGGRINPRKSFAAWKQIVQGHSRPWKEVHRQAALELRAAINALILKRTDDLLKLNTDLEDKNRELNSFAYIAAHDLQEPLRGLRNYSRFLMEDYGNVLDSEGREKLHTLSELARQMHELIDALAHYTKTGRMEIRERETDLNQLVHEVQRSRFESLRGVEIRVPRPLPTIMADSILVREVLDNLIANAIKYNTQQKKWIEIGYVEPVDDDPFTQQYYVRDNGIGIRPKHKDDVFTLFRRLHPRDRYGGGSGVGLALVKSIIDRHGGRVWFESEYGVGTTFYFTLGLPKS